MKAKRIFKLSLWVIFGLLVVMTFVFLYKKAQPQATIYSVETVTRVPSIQRSIILTGKIAPRNEVMIVPQLNGIIAEIMKKPGRGTHGHIAILTNNVDRAIYHLSQRGVKFDMDSKNVKDGKTIAIYFADEVAGFAIHLVQK